MPGSCCHSLQLSRYLERKKQEKEIQKYSLSKTRVQLEKEFIDLCLEVERQKKEVGLYQEKLEGRTKELDSYSLKIKEKEEFL